MSEVSASNPATIESLDAVQIGLEHREPTGSWVFYPFQDSEAGRRFEKPMQMALEMRVWGT